MLRGAGRPRLSTSAFRSSVWSCSTLSRAQRAPRAAPACLDGWRPAALLLQPHHTAMRRRRRQRNGRPVRRGAGGAAVSCDAGARSCPHVSPAARREHSCPHVSTTARTCAPLPARAPGRWRTWARRWSRRGASRAGRDTPGMLPV